MEHRFPLFLVALLAVPLAVAQAYDAGNLPYNDAPWDHKTSLAVSTLTEAGLVKGYPDGFFRPIRTVNRAEFLHVAMNTRIWTQVMPSSMNCFPDVRASDWFALNVCRAKDAGIVEGVTRPNDSRKWFEPERGVTYAEATKILMELFDIPAPASGSAWYERYLLVAIRSDLALENAAPHDLLTRGGMARLVAAFMAYENGDLDDYRDAERGVTASSSRSSRSSVRSSMTSTTSRSSSSRSSLSSSRSSQSSTSSQSSQSSVNVTVRSSFLLLGEDSSALVAGFNVFSNLEPVDLQRVIITLASPADSVNSFLVYDETGRLLGRATRGSTTTVYTLNVPDGTLTLGRRDDVSFSVRARLNAHDSGGESGEEVRVASVRVEGDGAWSNESFGQTTTETFPTFETARGIIESITNAGITESVITAGDTRLLGEFRIRGRRTDSQADVRLTSLSFTIETGGDVTLSDVDIRVAGSDAIHDCTVSSNTVTCASLPASIGEVDDGEKVLRVYGDVAISSGADDPYVRLTLNDPGSPTSAGSVSWTDGETTFTWLPLETPIARGTLYR